MWKSEYYMEIRCINDFSPAFVDPNLFVDSLTTGAVPVPAGIVMELQMSAVRALGNVNTQISGFTV